MMGTTGEHDGDYMGTTGERDRCVISIAEKKNRHLVSTRGWIPRHCIKEQQSKEGHDGPGDKQGKTAEVGKRTATPEVKNAEGRKKTKAKHE